ncbi:pilus assembly protein [Diaphorobacter aerolatus]|uniref:Uncharacterized protein n=1 Tax=Diaphorobacter aerolatus TaxID=1288495 RepID=A0A7H0GGA6_9BURK|nr:hypothetical protein [Diaphorobacter aerolatus]QNP47322.1 hypothetical protein H9K75_13255 [Diaphorobacter aerolatus]
MVAFGTGQELTEADSGDTAVQTVYAVMDYTRYRIQESGEDKGKALVDTTRRELPSPAASRADLMPQGVQDQPVSGDPRAGRIFWQLLNAPFNYCTRSPCGLNEKRGWYLDLPAERERVLDPIGFYGGGNLLEITSRVPATAVGLIAGDGQPIEACEQDPRPGQTYRTVLNILTGAAQKSRILDTNGDGQVTTDDAPASRSTAARQELRVPASDGAQLRQGSDGTTDRLQALPTRVLRPSWRHLK